MSQERNTENTTKPSPASDSPKEETLRFNAITLSRFMRANYGDQAAREAHRHIQAYTKTGQFELAAIWKRVLAHINGGELKDPARLVRSLKNG